MRKAIFVLLLLVSLPMTAFASGNFPTQWWSVGDDNYWNGTQFLQHTELLTDEEEGVLPEITIQRVLPDRQGGLDIYGDVPGEFTSYFGPAYSQINKRVEDVIDSLINEARRVRARSITFSYQQHETDTVVSILIEADVSSVISRTMVRSVNFNPDTGELVTIRDVMDFDVVPLAERLLADRMRREPENYYATQAIELDTQAFFVNRRGITILFDEFQLSAMVSGIRTLEISGRGIRSIELEPEDVLNTDSVSYGLLMVPLRRVAEGLGYHVEWCSEEQKAIIYNRSPGVGGQRLAWAHPGYNEYFTPAIERSLEAAPKIRNGGNMYVPITFFEQILTLTSYTVCSDGNIMFLAYLN